MISVETKKIYKKFPKGFLKPVQTEYVLNNINLQINPSEIFCLIGPNGAGKTTLIKILCGLILPTSGTAKINGFDVVKSEYHVKKSIGLITDYERSFYWRLTGRKNLEFFSSLYNISKNIFFERLSYLNNLLDLGKELDKRYQECSSGFKQRLSIARALIHNPDILFLDEPTRSLDPSASSNLRNFIKTELVKKQKKTVFFSTHDLKEAEFLADKIAVMNKGKILDCGSIENLKSNANKDTLEEVFKLHVADNRWNKCKN